MSHPNFQTFYLWKKKLVSKAYPQDVELGFYKFSFLIYTYRYIVFLLGVT